MFLFLGFFLNVFFFASSSLLIAQETGGSDEARLAEIIEARESARLELRQQRQVAYELYRQAQEELEHRKTIAEEFQRINPLLDQISSLEVQLAKVNEEIENNKQDESLKEQRLQIIHQRDEAIKKLNRHEAIKELTSTGEGSKKSIVQQIAAQWQTSNRVQDRQLLRTNDSLRSITKQLRINERASNPNLNLVQANDPNVAETSLDDLSSEQIRTHNKHIALLRNAAMELSPERNTGGMGLQQTNQDDPNSVRAQAREIIKKLSLLRVRAGEISVENPLNYLKEQEKIILQAEQRLAQAEKMFQQESPRIATHELSESEKKKLVIKREQALLNKAIDAHLESNVEVTEISQEIRKKTLALAFYEKALREKTAPAADPNLRELRALTAFEARLSPRARQLSLEEEKTLLEAELVKLAHLNDQLLEASKQHQQGRTSVRIDGREVSKSFVEAELLRTRQKHIDQQEKLSELEEKLLKIQDPTFQKERAAFVEQLKQSMEKHWDAEVLAQARARQPLEEKLAQTHETLWATQEEIDQLRAQRKFADTGAPLLKTDIAELKESPKDNAPEIQEKEQALERLQQETKGILGEQLAAITHQMRLNSQINSLGKQIEALSEACH